MGATHGGWPKTSIEDRSSAEYIVGILDALFSAGKPLL